MGKFFSEIYDPLMAPLEKRKFKRIRKQLISKACGCVLEIGSGTGVNFSFYEQVTHVSAIEPNPTMLKKSLPKTKGHDVPIKPQLGKAERLPYPTNSFDTVVGTLVFCTIPEPGEALSEICRVLKPKGKLLLFEHIRLNHRILGKMQDILTPTWKFLCDGCHLNRDTLQVIEKAGFHTENVESIYRGLFIIIQCTSPK